RPRCRGSPFWSIEPKVRAFSPVSDCSSPLSSHSLPCALFIVISHLLRHVIRSSTGEIHVRFPGSGDILPASNISPISHLIRECWQKNLPALGTCSCANLGRAGCRSLWERHFWGWSLFFTAIEALSGCLS